MNATNRLLVAIISILTCSTFATAQEINDNNTTAKPKFDESALQRIMPTRFGGRSRQWREEAAKAEELQNNNANNNGLSIETQATDSLHLPQFNQYGQPETIGYYPGGISGWYNWGLHRGLNVQLGASVFTQFGKGANSGVGFQQNIAMMYAAPITDKLSVAVGGYFNNINYANDNWRDVGLTAVLGYRFNEHWEAYVYGQKSITNNIGNRLRYSMYDGYYGGYYGPGMGGYGAFNRNFFGMPAYTVYDLSNMGDRIGATLKYNFNENLSIQVSVENRWMPSRY